jgi:hypothetical protein
MASLVGRAVIEYGVRQGGRNAKVAEETRKSILRWIVDAGCRHELESEESAFLRTGVGRADRETMMRAIWRNHGVAVLLWGLNRAELPEFDAERTPDVPVNRIGYLSSVAEADAADPPRLRSGREIDRLASLLTILSWRFTQYLATGHAGDSLKEFSGPPCRSGVQEPMDFEGFLRRHPSFKEYWLDGLRFLDGDLAVGAQTIAAIPPDRLGDYHKIVVERQIAAYWLQEGGAYSRIVSHTLLTGC